MSRSLRELAERVEEAFQVMRQASVDELAEHLQISDSSKCLVAGVACKLVKRGLVDIKPDGRYFYITTRALSKK